jgi:hypothetical protein
MQCKNSKMRRSAWPYQILIMRKSFMQIFLGKSHAMFVNTVVFKDNPRRL